jgi:hypothetical protein
MMVTMNEDEQPLSLSAEQIQQEAMRQYGRRLSRERALEIADEIERYERAIRKIAAAQELNNEPSGFLETLVRLRALDAE